MSVESTQNPHNALSGSYKELYLVEDLGETEEEMVPVGNLYEDFELSVDYEEVEINPASSEFTISFDTHKQIEASFSNFYTAPEEVLENFELINEDGEFEFGVTHEAARLVVYDTSPDHVDGVEDAIDVIELPEFVPRVDTLTFPEGDAISFDFDARVNGRPVKKDPAELNGAE